MKCDRVALIQNGKILSIDTPVGICQGFSRKLFMVKANEKFRLITALRSYPGTLAAYPFGDSVHLTLKNDAAGNSLLEHLNGSGLENVTVSEIDAGIEDRFLELMQRP